MTPCNKRCPHGTQQCTRQDGHVGDHEVYGDRFPGNPTHKSICTFKETA